MWVRVGLAVAFAYLGMAACSSSPDSGSKGSGGSSGDAGISFGASGCGQCVTAACASERSACGAQPTCAQYVTCLEGCGVSGDGNIDPACEAGCARPSEPAAQTAAEAFDACRASAACPACGGGADAGTDAPTNRVQEILNQQCVPSTHSNKCLNCIQSQCCDTENACNASPGCLAIYECQKSCETESCYKACFAQHPADVQTFLEMESCPLAKCATPAGCLDDPDPVTTCDNEHCVELRIACFIDVDCYLLFQCDVECFNLNPTTECFDGCEANRPAGALQLKGAWDTCSLAKCP